MIQLNLEADGLGDMMYTMNMLHEFMKQTVYTGVELTSKVRETVDVDVEYKRGHGRSRSMIGTREVKGGMTNADILDWFADNHGRDFRDPGGQEGRIGEAFIKNSIEKIPKKKVMKGYSGPQDQRSLIRALAKNADKDVEKVAKNLAAGGWKHAMFEYMDIVSGNIEAGNFNGPGRKELTAKYAEFKEFAVGFRYPIGKFSGQLIDALNPKGPASRNIKVQRSKK